jgi:hypothetical protein
VLAPAILPNNLAPYSRPEIDRQAERRQIFLNEFDLAGVALTNAESSVVDQICAFADSLDGSTIPSLARLNAQDRQTVDRLLRCLPQTLMIQGFLDNRFQ